MARTALLDGTAEARRTVAGDDSSPEVVVLVCDDAATPWTTRCLRQADVLVVVALAQGDPRPGPLEQEALASAARREAGCHLVLLQPSDARRPARAPGWRRGRACATITSVPVASPTTRAWHDCSPGGPSGSRCRGRRARLRAHRRPQGASGGWRPRRSGGRDQHGGDDRRGARPRDCAGRDARPLPGVDPRAAVERLHPAAGVDRPRPAHTARAGASAWRQADRRPLAALRVHHLEPDAATADAHTEGPLVRLVLASNSVPGLAPPVYYLGDVHVDGGVMDNLPVAVLRRMGAGRVIAVDVGTELHVAGSAGTDELPKRVGAPLGSALARSGAPAARLRVSDAGVHAGVRRAGAGRLSRRRPDASSTARQPRGWRFRSD